jgi:hypothetical protein
MDLQLRHLPGPTVDVLCVDGVRSRMFNSAPPGARHRHFLALMVGASGSSPLTPLGGPPSMFLSVDGRRSQIFSSGISRGHVVDVS